MHLEILVGLGHFLGEGVEELRGIYCGEYLVIVVLLLVDEHPTGSILCGLGITLKVCGIDFPSLPVTFASVVAGVSTREHGVIGGDKGLRSLEDQPRVLRNIVVSEAPLAAGEAIDEFRGTLVIGKVSVAVAGEQRREGDGLLRLAEIELGHLHIDSLLEGLYLGDYNLEVLVGCRHVFRHGELGHGPALARNHQVAHVLLGVDEHPSFGLVCCLGIAGKVAGIDVPCTPVALRERTRVGSRDDVVVLGHDCLVAFHHYVEFVRGAPRLSPLGAGQSIDQFLAAFVAAVGFRSANHRQIEIIRLCPGTLTHQHHHACKECCQSPLLESRKFLHRLTV